MNGYTVSKIDDRRFQYSKAEILEGIRTNLIILLRLITVYFGIRIEMVNIK